VLAPPPRSTPFPYTTLFRSRVSSAWLPASSCWRGAPHRDGSRIPVKLRVLLRLIEIQRVLLRHGLDDYVRATHLYRPLRFVFFLDRKSTRLNSSHRTISYAV